MKKEAILGLKNLNVDLIVLHYSGGGDSGAIDDFLYYKKIEDGDSFDLNNFEEMFKIDFDTKLIEDFAYPILNEIEDWWNNEGGNGMMYINLESMEYKIENEIRVYNYDTYYHDGSFKITE
jgi:hypothetical protein